MINKTLIKTFFILQVILFAFSAQAQEITAIDFSGKVIGKVLPDAKVINLENNVIGNINIDGQIINLEGDIIGGIAPQGVAIGNDFVVLGRPNQDGKIISASGKEAGTVLPNGLVINKSYDVIGAVLFPGIVYSDAGEYVGRLSADGLYTNISGQSIGFITPDGYAYKRIADNYVLDGKLVSSKMILSLQGKLIGAISPDASAYDFGGKKIGTLHANGYVYDANKKAVARIASNAYAFDNIGNPIGFITYDGKISGKETKDYSTFYNNTIVDKDLNPVGFSVNTNATATDLKGNYLGAILPTGAISKGQETKGFISAKGVILDASGNIIGKISKTGPIYNYKSDIISHALHNGKTYNLNGAQNGFIKGSKAYDNSGKISGIVYSPKVLYSNDNDFLGLTGLSNKIDIGTKLIISTMYGYIFDEEGGISGQSLGLDYIYNAQGTLLGLINAQGVATSFSEVLLGKILGNGFVVDEFNKIVGKTFLAKYIENKKDLKDLLLSQTNALLNKGGKQEAKILPDSSIIKNSSQKSVELMPQLGSAYNQIMAVSYDGTLLGYVDYDNVLRDFSGSKIGSIFSGGIVTDNNGFPMGEVVSLGTVMDFNCKTTAVLDLRAEAKNYRGVLQGRALTQGFVISEGKITGYIAKKGNVIDINGNIVGYVSNNGQAYNVKKESLGCINSQARIKNKEVVAGAVVEFLPAISFDNQIIGRSIIDGKVVNNNSINIGYIQPSGGVTSNTGEPIGLLLKYKYAFDDTNIFMGLINEKAEVINEKKEVIAKVSYDGTIIQNKKPIGYALYDLYVYDKDFMPIGYINFSGEVTSFSGQKFGRIKRGFLLNEKEEVIARANRDYFIRNASQIIVGELKLSGDLNSAKGISIGKINKIGEIFDDKQKFIAKARPLQYYSNLNVSETKNLVVDEEGSVIGFVDEFGDYYDNNGIKLGYKDKDGKIQTLQGESIGTLIEGQKAYNEKGEEIGTISADGTVRDANGKIIGNVNEDGEVIDANGNIIGGVGKDWYKKVKDPRPKSKRAELSDFIRPMSIALTPDGEYLCDLLEDGTCVDKSGKIVGRKQPDGLIIDDSGTLIGIEETSKVDADDIFVPSGSFGPGGAYGIGNTPINLGPGGGYGPGERYDPTRARALAAAQNNRRQASAVGAIKSGFNPSSFDYKQDDWGGDVPSALSSWRVDLSEMILADKPIPAVLARSIYNTSTDVPVTAVVERNVYSEEGRNIIIPAGSRLIGSVEGFGSSQSNTSNAAKVNITWERLIRPDGSMFKLDDSVTGDSQGRQGALGYVDTNLAERYTSPILTSIVTSAISMYISTDDDSSGEVETSKQQAANDARENFLDSMDQVFNQMLQDKLNEEVLIFVPAGTRIVIYPKKDLWLRTPEREQRQEAFASDKEVKALIGKDSDLQDTQGSGGTSTSSDQTGASVNDRVVYDSEKAPDAQKGGTPLIGGGSSKKSNDPIVVPPPPPPSQTGASSSTQKPSTSKSSAPVLF